LLVCRRNIQVDNPVAILDQEEAKKFLTGKAEDKYSFFMKATELERVDRTFNTTMETIDEMQATNSRSKEGLQTSIAHVDELRKKWKEHHEIGKLETKYLKSSTEFAWACYAQHDIQYNTLVTVRSQWNRFYTFKTRSGLTNLFALATIGKSGGE
jgi:predicted nuclease with TOPRIM domain